MTRQDVVNIIAKFLLEEFDPLVRRPPDDMSVFKERIDTMLEMIQVGSAKHLVEKENE